jgi:hypothetical protein
MGQECLVLKNRTNDVSDWPHLLGSHGMGLVDNWRAVADARPLARVSGAMLSLYRKG